MRHQLKHLVCHKLDLFRIFFSEKPQAKIIIPISFRISCLEGDLKPPSCPQGPDFGYVTREPRRKDVSSLDSFGNLEVSPPVTVDGRNYPLGRILIGVAFPT